MNISIYFYGQLAFMAIKIDNENIDWMLSFKPYIKNIFSLEKFP